MAHAPHASILFRLNRVQQAPAEPDPADVGTAFGLELSLREDAPEAPERGSEDDAPRPA